MEKEENNNQYTEEEVLEFIKSKKDANNEVITAKVDAETAKLLSSEVKEKEIEDSVYEVENSNKTIFNTDDSASVADVFISDKEKEDWLKSILLDTAATLDINLCNNNLVYKIKSLSISDDLLLAKILKDPKSFGFYTDDVIDLARKLIIAMNLISENDNNFFKLSFLSRFKSKIAILREKVKILNNISFDKYKLLINAFKVFDRKIFLLNTNILNNSFWKPLS